MALEMSKKSSVILVNWPMILSTSQNVCFFSLKETLLDSRIYLVKKGKIIFPITTDENQIILKTFHLQHEIAKFMSISNPDYTKTKFSKRLPSKKLENIIKMYRRLNLTLEQNAIWKNNSKSENLRMLKNLMITSQNLIEKLRNQTKFCRKWCNSSAANFVFETF